MKSSYIFKSISEEDKYIHLLKDICFSAETFSAEQPRRTSQLLGDFDQVELRDYYNAFLWFYQERKNANDLFE
jgi:hypothetical protein